MEIADRSKGIARQPLLEANMHPNPIDQFRTWFEVALTSSEVQPTAMSLATVNGEGQPSARIVLLKGFDDAGFVFFTNYESRKGQELDQNPRVALVLYWASLERQIRIEGRAFRVSKAESDAYFQTRPHGSRLSTWVSKQSEILASREVLDQRMRVIMDKYAHDVPRPPYWGGYRIRPEIIEFWQGQENRLHDRLRYSRIDGTGWRIERLAP